MNCHQYPISKLRWAKTDSAGNSGGFCELAASVAMPKDSVDDFQDERYFG